MAESRSNWSRPAQIWMGFGQSTNVGRFRTRLAANLVEIGPMRSNMPRCWPKLVEHSYIGSKSAQMWTEIGEVGPRKSTRFGRRRPQKRAKEPQTSPKDAQRGPKEAHRAQSGPKEARKRPKEATKKPQRGPSLEEAPLGNHIAQPSTKFGRVRHRFRWNLVEQMVTIGPGRPNLVVVGPQTGPKDKAKSPKHALKRLQGGPRGPQRDSKRPQRGPSPKEAPIGSPIAWRSQTSAQSLAIL